MPKRICANCKESQGPFSPIQLFYNPTIWVCKNTKQDKNRVTVCVDKRSKIDTDKYKELLHVYDQ